MPLSFDKPLKDLKNYKGTNPRPKDFDSFWDKSIREMRSLDPDVELKKADFESPFGEYFHLYFTGTGNARVHAKFARPRKAKKGHPAIVRFHGYSGDAGDWVTLNSYLAMGYSIAALDCRGQGGLSQDNSDVRGWTLRGQIIRGLEDAPEKLYFRNVYLDTALMTRIVMDMPEVDEKRVGAMGGSQGGGLTVACIGLEPRIKLAAPVFPFLTDYKRVWEMDQAANAYEELAVFFRKKDPLHNKEDEYFTKLGYIDVQFLCPRIKTKVLWFTGLMDKVCPPSTQFAAYNKIKSPKKMVIYPDFGHEGLPGQEDTTFQFMRGL